MKNTSNEEFVFKANDDTLKGLITNIAYRKIDALSDLYRLTKSAIYGYALSFLQNHSDAKIVLHSTFLSIWVSAYMYTGQGKPMSWIMMIAKNHCFKIMRNRKWYSNLYSSENTSNKPNNLILSIEESAVLDCYLNTLEDNEREVAVLSVILGFSTVDIANFLNLPIFKIITLKNSAFKKLKKVCSTNQNLSHAAISTSLLKDSLRGAVAKTTCENWNNIAFDLANGRGEVIGMSDKKQKNRLAGFIRNCIYFLIIVTLVVFGITNYNRADLKPVSTVYVEADAQFELSLNTYNVVLGATAKNESGEKVLSENNTNNAELGKTVSGIFKSLIKNGYLTEKSNAIMIRVENSSETKSSTLQNTVALQVKNALKEQDLKLNVVIVRSAADDDVNGIISNAKKHNISQPKADFIAFLANGKTDKSYDLLATFSVKDLVSLFKGVTNFDAYKYENDPDFKVIYISNDPAEISANSKEPVDKLDLVFSPDIAIKKALAHAQLSSSKVYDIKAQFDDDNPDNYHYDVVFTFGGYKYEYEIDAIGGDVIKHHKSIND